MDQLEQEDLNAIIELKKKVMRSGAYRVAHELRNAEIEFSKALSRQWAQNLLKKLTSILKEDS